MTTLELELLEAEAHAQLTASQARADLAALLVELAREADDPSAQRAYTKASYHILGGLTPRAVDDDALLVPSASGSTVYVASPVTCSCAAYDRAGAFCWHRAIALATAVRRHLLTEYAASWATRDA